MDSPPTWLQTFLDRLAADDLSAATRRGYRYDLQHFIAWYTRLYDAAPELSAAMYVMVRPLAIASSRQRCSRLSSAVSSGGVFFKGCGSIPGTVPAIKPARLAQLDDSDQGGILLEGVRDLLKLSGRGIGNSIAVDTAAMVSSPRRPPPFRDSLLLRMRPSRTRQWYGTARLS